MPQTSFAVMTTLGRAKEAAALANATTITITQIAIGDGATVPSGGETALYHEVARKPISGHGTVVGAANVAYFDCYLAAGDGPYTIREAGLYDDAGDLIAICHYDPPINKPVPSSGQTVEGTVRLEVAFSDVANVTIVVDPSMQVALQRLTRLPWIPVISMSLSAPPADPAVGDTYVINSGPTGAWTGQQGKIAEFTVAGWAIITPPNGHGVSLPDGRIFERIAGAYVPKVANDVQSGKWLYGADTGSASAFVLTLDPVPAVVAAGTTVRLKLANTNAAAPTLNVNGVGAKPIIFDDGSAPAGGEFLAGGILEVVYTGTAWQVLGFAKAASRKIALLFTRARFTTVGTTNWTVPAGITSIRVKVWGGGGGGGYCGVTTGAPAGGGAGGYAEKVYDVTPGQVIPVTVGAGGAGGVNAAQNGARGDQSKVVVGAMQTVADYGLGGGLAPSNGIANGGAGGGAYYDYDFMLVGGRGDDGVTYAIASGGAKQYGGWGGAAPNGGTAAAGGYGGVANGSVPGGGGGSSANSSNQNGGNGARGEVWIEY